MFGIDDAVKSITGGGGLGGLGGIGALASLGGGGGGGSKQNYGKAGGDYLKKLNAYQAGMPTQYAIQAEYGPKYAGLNLANLGNTLLGVNGQRGYLDLYGNDILPRLTAANNAATTAARTSTVQDFSNLSPLMALGLRNSNPQVASLYDKLAQQAGDGLDAGNRMTGDDLRGLNASLRSSMGARGISYGPASSYAEAMAGSQYGNQLANQRREFAGNIAQLGNSLYTLPALQAFGMTPEVSGSGQNFLGMGSAAAAGAVPTLFSNEDASGLFSMVQNNKNAQSIASKNNRAALWGSAIGGLGSLGGSGIMAAAL